MSKTTSNIKEKMEKLDALLAWFDGEDFILEQAIEKFHEAEELAAAIEHDLTKMKNEVTVIAERFDSEQE